MLEEYTDYAWLEEKIKSNKKMDGKSKHPFNITCRKCGSNRVMVVAYEHHDLGIRCRNCGYELNCGIYYTDENDYSDM